MTPSIPVPISMDAVFLLETFAPNGHKVKTPILKAARAHGIPIMVIAMMNDARNQHKAELNPPKQSHNIFKRKFILIVYHF